MKSPRNWKQSLWLCLTFFLAGASVWAESGGLFKITVDQDELILLGKNVKSSLRIVELAPYESITNASRAQPITAVAKKGRFKISLPRFEGERDRLYSAFVAVENGSPVGGRHFVEEWKNLGQSREAYPAAKSKKGLQVQMMDDAITLGVQHAALNFNLGQMVLLDATTNDFVWKRDGRTFHFQRSYIEHTDRRVKPLSDAGMTVSLILLNYEGGNPALNAVLLHPTYDKTCPEKLSAFNTSTAEGLAWFKASLEFLAHRYSKPASAGATQAARYPHGRVANYIVGNEVNSHRWWSNMGRVSMEQFADDYARTLRITHAAVRLFSSTARVFISLEHHWNIRYAAGDEMQAFAARPFLDYLNALTKGEGDFDWHVAFHPYPENLFECRTWNDKSATFTDDTPRITFKNLEMLPRYLQRKERLHAGKPRRIILSEQGFHSPPTAEGELWQAAAYCYAYRRTVQMDGIDAFILHRHVDHKLEGGLNLGLWRRQPESIATPGEKKPIYAVFQKADTAQWREAFQFALPVIGIPAWEELRPAQRKK